jgi:3-deoxy-7-phosphoheptulonate synthase
MLVVMNQAATEADVGRVCRSIENLGFEARPIPGEQRTSIGVVGNEGRVDSASIEGLPGVLRVIHVSSPYKQVSREWRPDDTVIEFANGTKIGDGSVTLIGGPCSIESEEQIQATAKAVAAAGGKLLRGGAFKPRSSPYSFQGLGEEGLRLMVEAGRANGLAVVTEALDLETADLIGEQADMIQIGARNMQNFTLLKHVGRMGRPVMLKRGMSATLEEWLLAAEYILSEGNGDVLLCERGIRSYDRITRNVLDLAAIPLAKSLSHLPVIADPSHGTGRRDMVRPMGLAAVAAGADGLMIETHPDPDAARSDAHQTITLDAFAEIASSALRVSRDVGTVICG